MSSTLSEPYLQIRQTGPVTVAAFTQPVLFHEEEIDCIGEQLRALITDSGCRLLVLNFAAVSHVASHLLGELIVLHKKMIEADGHLALCEFTSQLQETFQMLRLTLIFNVYDTEDEALRAFRPA